jgi:DDE superfamily endonuclease
VITYRATLDVPTETLEALSGWLAAQRRQVGTRRGRRSLTPRQQAVLVLRWFRDDTPLRLLAHDARIGVSTAYRYLHEGIDVLADQAPDLHDVLERGRQEDWSHVSLDGTLIATDRVAQRTENGNHLWYSGKHKRPGGNVQVLSDPTGFPVWTSPVEPGSTHNLTAARTHVLGALYPAAAGGLPTLTDKGYTGAGIGIHVPIKGHHLDPDTTTANLLLTCLRALGERANALLKTRWRALNRIRLCPWRITNITAAALVLTTLERGRY